MSFSYEGPHSIWFGTAVQLVDKDREVAWAERSVRDNPTHRYFVGSYVEADNPNRNRQFWTHDALKASKDTIINSPVNWAHQGRRVIGHYVDAEMMYPLAEGASQDDPANPFIESLGVLYKAYFPHEVALLEHAYEEGTLFQSMECVAKTVTCGGASGCGKEFAYSGPKHTSYCECLNDGPGVKQLNNPIFMGGGLLIPPTAPGWTKARISDLAGLMKEHAEQIERSSEAPEFANLSEGEWESVMMMVMSVAHGLTS